MKQRLILAWIALGGLTILAAFLLFIPVFTALAAGLASLSIVIFGTSTILLLIGIFTTSEKTRWLLVGALTISLAGLIIPQYRLWRAADYYRTDLGFQPVEYVRFNGSADIKPRSTLSYKKVGDHSLRIAQYSPASNAPKPAVVLLHGGGWRYGNYLETGLWSKQLSDAGYAVFSVEYRRSSATKTSWQESPSDVHDALVYLRGHASELGIQPDHLTLLGQSAGGHLALLEAYRNSTVNSVIALYAPIDLTLDYQTSWDKSAELTFIGGTPAQYPERYRSLSPLSYVSATSPQTLLIQGERDDLVDPKNTELLSEQLGKNNVPHRVVMLPMTGHSFENQRGGFATQITTQNVLNFLKSN